MVIKLQHNTRIQTVSMDLDTHTLPGEGAGIPPGASEHSHSHRGWSPCIPRAAQQYLSCF